MRLKSPAGLGTIYLKAAGIWAFKYGREAEMIETIMKVMSCTTVYLISALQWQWNELPSWDCLTYDCSGPVWSQFLILYENDETIKNRKEMMFQKDTKWL